jgi:hypothetical protein
VFEIELLKVTSGGKNKQSAREAFLRSLIPSMQPKVEVLSATEPTVIAPPVFVPPATFVVPNLEELMRRRNMIHSDAPEVGPASTPLDEEAMGPSLPDPSIQSYDPQSDSSSKYGLSGVPGPASAVSSRLTGPKVVKVDSSLKSFVPAALRVKRPVNESDQKASYKISKIAAEDDDAIVNGNRFVSSLKPLQPSATSTNNVEDAYADFMNEINLIGSDD